MGGSDHVDQQKQKKKKKGSRSSGISFRLIFMHADGWDTLLMGLGLLGAFGDGVSMPAMLLVTSKLMNSFGDSQTSVTDEFSHNINKVGSLFWCRCTFCCLVCLLSISCYGFLP